MWLTEKLQTDFYNLLLSHTIWCHFAKLMDSQKLNEEARKQKLGVILKAKRLKCETETTAEHECFNVWASVYGNRNRTNFVSLFQMHEALNALSLQTKSPEFIKGMHITCRFRTRVLHDKLDINDQGHTRNVLWMTFSYYHIKF